MTLSTHAAAAKAIRQQLKKNGVKAKVKAKSYSMGSSVNVTLENPLPATIELVKEFCSGYQYGHFDGMTDCYEYSNSDNSIPQVKFVQVNASYSPEVKQSAWKWLLENVVGFEGAPEKYSEAHNFYNKNFDGYSGMLISRVLIGQLGNFWSTRKPRIKLAN